MSQPRVWDHCSLGLPPSLTSPRWDLHGRFEKKNTIFQQVPIVMKRHPPPKTGIFRFHDFEDEGIVFLPIGELEFGLELGWKNIFHPKKYAKLPAFVWCRSKGNFNLAIKSFHSRYHFSAICPSDHRSRGACRK